MPDDVPAEEAEGRHRRGLKFRKREDYAVELFREAEAHLSDIARVDRILLELGRFYNPLLNGPIVDLGTRQLKKNLRMHSPSWWGYHACGYTFVVRVDSTLIR